VTALVSVVFALTLATTPTAKRFGGYEVTVRPPEGGLCAGEEQQLEFRIADLSRVDPVMGPAAVIRARVRAVIDMPSMPSMPKFEETAHLEAVPGDYGVHPVFAHGGEYRMTLAIAPLEGEPFEAQFPLAVADGCAARAKVAPPWKLELTARPKSPRAGQPAALAFEIRHRDAPRVAHTAFDLAHEKRMHLIVVRKDLNFFSHVHPELDDAGVFRLTHTFPSAGEYHLFADVAPRGAGSQILLAKIKVGGDAVAPPPPSSPGVALAWPDGTPAGKTIPLTATVNPSDGLEKYLGAMGHVILIHEDGVSFVHSHPDERDGGGASGGVIRFLARFPKAGRYRGWAQFQRNGVLSTADFSAEAR
jgi:hypothetical protein